MVTGSNDRTIITLPGIIFSYVEKDKKDDASPESQFLLDLFLKAANGDVDTFTAEFTTVGPNLGDRMSLSIGADTIPGFIDKGILRKTVTDVTKTNRDFNFERNGFQFLDFRGEDLGKQTDAIAKAPEGWVAKFDETIKPHAMAVEKALGEWGKKSGLKFSQAVWIDSVYRNTAAGKFGAVHFAHVDFPPNDDAATLKGHSNWKDRVVIKMGDMTREQYEKLSIAAIINIWMPLDDEVVAEPLTLMDVDSQTNLTKDMHVYEDKRLNGGDAYLSVAFNVKPNQKWYVKDRMQRGQGVVFDCCRTPHSAISLPDQGTKSRRSIETRVLFLK